MQRLVVGFVVGGVLGTGFGFAVGILVFPYLFPPPEVNEPLADKTEREIVAHARFVHANPADLIHYGRGTATLYDDLVRLEPDFAVGPGPKFHVYLVPLSEVAPDTDVEQTMFVDLGRLKSFAGSQNYPIPEGTDLAGYGSVVIWCEQFNVLISPAAISFVH